MLPYLGPASVATVYLAGVVFVALRLGGSAAVLAVVASILMFDLLAIEPRWSLKPTDAQHYFTFLVMLIVGILVSRLADHARQQARVADARAGRPRRSTSWRAIWSRHKPSRISGTGWPPRCGRRLAPSRRCCCRTTHGQLIDPWGFCRAAGSPDGAPEIELAQRAFDSGPGGESVDAAPTPGQLLCLPLQGAGGPLGVLAVRLPGQRFATPEDRRLLDAFANQAALALERSLFARRSAKAVVEAETERFATHCYRASRTTSAAADDHHRFGQQPAGAGRRPRRHATLAPAAGRAGRGAAHARLDDRPARADPHETAALLAAFATYAAGFLVRPFGAIVFGRIGDLVGRKYTFLVTIVVMGAATSVGLLPTFAASAGWRRSCSSLRLVQGLALGGEYGGAATYVAEHAPHHRRGYDTSWIQTTATLGFFLALAGHRRLPPAAWTPRCSPTGAGASRSWSRSSCSCSRSTSG